MSLFSRIAKFSLKLKRIKFPRLDGVFEFCDVLWKKISNMHVPVHLISPFIECIDVLKKKGCNIDVLNRNSLSHCYFFTREWESRLIIVFRERAVDVLKVARIVRGAPFSRVHNLNLDEEMHILTGHNPAFSPSHREGSVEGADPRWSPSARDAQESQSRR